MSKRFRVAFAFAGEKRRFVEEVAHILAERFGEDQILYDKFHEAEFASAQLAFHLPVLYAKEAELVVAVLCRDYDQNEWCGLEWNAVYSLIKRREVDEVMLCRFDRVEGRGLFGMAGFLELDEKTPAEAAKLILQRLAINEGHPKDYYTSAPAPPAVFDWPEVAPPLNWPVANQSAVRDAFARLITRVTPCRALFLHGGAETGKSLLTKVFLSNTVHLPGTICGRFDFRNDGDFYSAIAHLAYQLDVEPPGRGGTLVEQLHHVLVTLDRRPAPTLLILDTFELAGEAERWVRESLLFSLIRMRWLRVVVVGQRVPRKHGEPWAPISFDPIELKQPSPEEWFEHVRPLRPEITLEFVHQVHAMCRGRSAILAQLLGPADGDEMALPRPHPTVPHRADDAPSEPHRPRPTLLNETKLMLVGEGGAGKTSLRRFFLGEEHQKDEAETLGIALHDFRLPCGSEEITVHLWDFAGQEITHALHQFFLTSGCIYLVVVEPRSDNEEADVEKWLKLIERYGAGAPAIVVMNKQDIRQPRGYDLDRNRLRERYPFVADFIRTTCGQNRNGCEDLRNRLREALAAMPDAKREMPESWLRVKNECFQRGRSGQKRQYLSLDEFRALCAQHGETDPKQQEILATILHILGAVLHFANDPRLRDTAVLNPHWITDGAYRLLRTKDGPGSDGILSLEEAMRAVPGADEGAARYLLHLMERFEMCFPVGEDLEEGPGPLPPARQWLIPGALDRNQPDGIIAREWSDPAAVRLRYVYDPLPQGVLPRFIVMTHLLSEGLPRWRHGVVIRDCAAQALIRKGQRENTVDVIVQGTGADRERLTRAVRGYLARIHQDLPEPRPKEYQALAGTHDFRAVDEMCLQEKAGAPILVEKPDGFERKDVTTELNRTSDEAPRRGQAGPLKVFLSYSRDDKRAKDAFRKNLMVLKGGGYIDFWEDLCIEPGAEWRPEIDDQLRQMDIFIGLVTTPWLASDFIQRVEFTRALQRRADGCALWLVLVDETDFDATPAKHFQMIKPADKAVSQHRNLRTGFDLVAKVIRPRVVKLWEERCARAGTA